MQSIKRFCAHVILTGSLFVIQPVCAQWNQCESQPQGAITCSTGAVGVGLTNPAEKLDVNGSIKLSGGTVAAYLGQPVGAPGWLYLTDYATGTKGIKLNLTTGNVGIGTSNPLSKLDVNGDANISGNITLTGNINAKYQDVAEWVPADRELAPGTVVTLDPQRGNHVVASSAAYDTSVAGVVSAQPGIVLGVAGTDKAVVATTGRVNVRADATQHPIHIGDLLVSSDVPGVAMKSEPMMINGRSFHQPGTIIGKALEPLDRGRGEILVLLSLQ